MVTGYDGDHFGQGNAMLRITCHLDYLTLGCSGDLLIHRISRFECRDASATASKCQTNRLKNLVRTVGNKNLFGLNIMDSGNIFTETLGQTIGIPVPVDTAHFIQERREEPCGRGKRRLVGVETNFDIKLR